MSFCTNNPTSKTLKFKRDYNLIAYYNQLDSNSVEESNSSALYLLGKYYPVMVSISLKFQCQALKHFKTYHAQMQTLLV